MTRNLNGKSTADDVVEGLDLSAQRILVTGANTGIGFDTARALAAAGATVIVPCRTQAKSDDTAARIRTALPDARVETGVLDLGDFASVQACADALGSAPLHTLIANAGLTSLEWGTTTEGIEQTVGVCHFGHFLLARRLMPNLLATDAPRVVMVSSESHRSPRRLDFDRFPLTEDGYKGLIAYGQAKLCNVFFARSLQARYGDRGLTACSLHPGTLITTDIGRNSTFVSVLMKLVSPLTKNCNQGAATTVWGATHEPAAELQGAYLRDCAVGECTSESKDAAAADRLWSLSEDVLAQYLEDAVPAWP